MEEKQILKLMTATIAPLIQSAISSDFNSLDLGGDGKISDVRFNQIVELADWYARKLHATD